MSMGDRCIDSGDMADRQFRWVSRDTSDSVR